MLTNTLVLFLRDLLPMFIMFAYLQCIFVHNKTLHLPYMLSLIMASVFAFLILLYYENIGELFSGTGIEWLKISLISFSFLGFVCALVERFSHIRHNLLAMAAGCLLILHFSSFMLYFTIYLAYQDLIYELLIACAIGIGICVSFYFLFSFVIREFWQAKFKKVVLMFWSLFVANQLSFISNYLQQIDVVSIGSERLVNLSTWVKDESEYGFILKALTGFESTPSVFYVLVLLFGFTGIFVFSVNNKRLMLGDDDD